MCFDSIEKFFLMYQVCGLLSFYKKGLRLEKGWEPVLYMK